VRAKAQIKRTSYRSKCTSNSVFQDFPKEIEDFSPKKAAVKSNSTFKNSQLIKNKTDVQLVMTFLKN
jgi:hypothetical protein